jgi:hypothetical protein
VKAQTVVALKRQESQRRMSAATQAKRSLRIAERLQKRASLVGGAAKWKIVNLEKSFAAMAKWARSAR